MKSERIILLTLCLLLGVSGWAEDKKPDFLIADNSFFDPTKKKEEVYHFGMEYRLEFGYVQKEQRSNGTYPGMYMHGGQIGATFTFLLPIHFSLQTGLLYTITYGLHQQHWPTLATEGFPKVEYIQHRVMEHQLTIPLRMYYTVPLWRKLNLFFYTGPQLHIGLAAIDRLTPYLTDNTRAWVEEQGVTMEAYDRYTSEQNRVNVQWGLGAGIEWDRYRFVGGYDFGLNNLIRYNDTYRFMSEWQWHMTLAFRL